MPDEDAIMILNSCCCRCSCPSPVGCIYFRIFKSSQNFICLL